MITISGREGMVGTMVFLLTFDYPLHFKFPGIERTLDPAVLPSKEFDKFNLQQN